MPRRWQAHQGSVVPGNHILYCVAQTLEKGGSRLKTIAYIVDPTLGHVARAHQIACQVRRSADVRIVFITPDERGYVRQFLDPDYETHHIPTRSVRDPLIPNRFAPGLEQALGSVRPDLIVHDLCPLRYLSTARLPDCPRVHVTNAFLTGPAGNATFQARWFEDIGPAVNATRAEKGLPPIGSAHQLYEADRVLCADPGFVAEALPVLPPHYTVCGHIGFEVDADIPDPLRDTTDLMIMSMGSTGPSGFSADLLRDLRDRSGSSAIIYVGRPMPKLAELGVLDGMFEWLPLHRILDRARLVVTQGGTGSSYQALAYGRPVAVLPQHTNHEILGRILQDCGVGVMCNEAVPSRIDFAAMHNAATALAAGMQTRRDGAKNAATAIIGLL